MDMGKLNELARRLVEIEKELGQPGGSRSDPEAAIAAAEHALDSAADPGLDSAIRQQFVGFSRQILRDLAERGTRT